MSEETIEFRILMNRFFQKFAPEGNESSSEMEIVNREKVVSDGDAKKCKKWKKKKKENEKRLYFIS